MENDFKLIDKGTFVMENIQISVICTSYNYEQYITKALDSIINQKTNFTFEIIVVDDCSTDSSRDILKTYQQQYPNLIRLFFNDKNKGLTQTWIDICKEAKGKYIARCDADDYWIDLNKLQKQFDVLEKKPSFLWCNTSFNIVDKNDNTIAEDVFRHGTIAYANTYEKMIATKGMTLTSSWLVDTKLMQAVNNVIDPFSVDDGFPMQLEFFQKTDLAFIDSPCVAYRLTSNSDSRPDSEEKMIKRINGLLSTQLEYVDKYPHQDMKKIAKILMEHDAKQEHRIYRLNKEISDIKSDKIVSYLQQIRKEKITIYFDEDHSGFNQDRIKQYPLHAKDELDIIIPDNCEQIRIDMSECTSFYDSIALISKETGTQIMPSLTNAIVLEDSYIFPDSDPQMLFELPESIYGKAFILKYTSSDVSNIYSSNYIGKKLARDLSALETKYRELLVEKKRLTAKNNEQRTLIDEVTQKYHSVIFSKRWSIPTKIINFFRRKK